MPQQTGIVAEFPLTLQVNGRELATLVASSHELRFLVAGFLRLQGFVERIDDFDLLAVCEEFGVANVRIKKELPERLKPVLTSGCGTGITFSLEQSSGAAVAAVPVSPEALFRLMDELARRADQYKSHGGIHSAAVGDLQGQLVLYAEDIGRHNTLDRIAGEALFRQQDLSGMLLATSGRVSAEMALKGARLGVACIASRTSPTDMAVTICRQAGITLIGYLRGEQFTVYSGVERLELPRRSPRLQRIDAFFERAAQQSCPSPTQHQAAG
jgi:FdhD protein